MAISPKIKPAPAVRAPLASEAPAKPAPAAAASSPRSLKTLPSETSATSGAATHAPALLGQELSGEPPAKPVETAAAPIAPAPIAPAPAAPAPAVQTAPEEAPANPASGKGYFLQIGAYKSQDDADAAWRAFKSAHPAATAYYSNVKAADLGDKGVWYRLRIGAFSDKDAAAAICVKLKSEGASCFLAR
jgi:cell division protein FtsN